jgi:o-succinylbenzoate synthase
MNIYCSDYELISYDNQRIRQGSLFRVEFEDGLIGYCDCHPGIDLGDNSLAEQKNLLLNGKISQLLRRSFHFARMDAEARRQKKSLLSALVFPKSHFLLLNLTDASKIELPFITQAGFTCLKIKMGNALDFEIKNLKELCERDKECFFKLRLDFNLKLNQVQFESFLENFKEELHRIDFCEDPFPFDRHAWAKIQANYKVDLACDYENLQAVDFLDAAKYLIVKPAIENENIFLNGDSDQKIVFTSYLDHPLGQMCAAYVAAKSLAKNPHKIVDGGLCSHIVYRDNMFSKLLNHSNANFIPAEGTGFGFDNIFPTLEWKKLNEYQLALI